MQRAAEEMKRKILEADLDRREKKVLTEQELEAQERAQAQVERAGALRMEQEEEIRMLNKVEDSLLLQFWEGYQGLLFCGNISTWTCWCLLSWS